MADEHTEAAVLASFDALIDALCVRRDAEDAISQFVDEDNAALWGSTLSELAIGKSAIRELVHELLTASPASFELRWDVRHVRVVGDVAWVNAAGVAVNLPDDGSTPNPYRISAVLLRQEDTWRWHTFNGSEPVKA